MFRSLYTAASGMEAQELNLDNIANNLSNSNTAGFRRRRVQFEDLIYQSLVTPGAQSTQQTIIPAGLQVGLGARSATTEMIQQQGNFNSTGNPLDLAIQGPGFFQVLCQAATLLTRGREISASITSGISSPRMAIPCNRALRFRRTR